MPERVDGFAGAPQTIYSDHFLDIGSRRRPDRLQARSPTDHPILAATTLPGDGAAHARWMRELPHMQVVIALLRDGFHPESPGGSVGLRSDGTPVLDYPLNDYLWDGARRAFATMAEIQFAAGAKTVMPVHAGAASFTSWGDALAGIAALSLAPQIATVSALT